MNIRRFFDTNILLYAYDLNRSITAKNLPDALKSNSLPTAFAEERE